MAKFQSEEVGRNLREIAHCLKSGNLILSPFENPIEEERRGDPDQSDDNSNYFGKEQVCDAVEVLPGGKKSVQNAANKSRFRFFLDGSIRTKYVGEFIEGGLSFPLIVSEVAVAVMQRKDRKIVPFMVDKKIYFVFPKKDSALISDTTYENLKSAVESALKRASNDQVTLTGK